MSEKHFPTEEQLFGLYRLLTLLKNSELFWFEIKYKGDKIIIKVEPQKSEIDIRVFYIFKTGEVDDDGFGEYRLL